MTTFSFVLMYIFCFYFSFIFVKTVFNEVKKSVNYNLNWYDIFVMCVYSISIAGILTVISAIPLFIVYKMV